MTIRPQPTQNEKVLREDDFIVSKTDLKGLITYGNRIFIEVSGYSEQELLGAPHSILRHPDMPRAVFKLLWDTIQAKREICAYVKNLAKDGSFYWVFANITPSFDRHGNLIGYYSVRRKPRAEAVQTMSGLYRAMLDAERRAGDGQAGMKASTALLHQTLAQKDMSYEEFVFGL
ncbi:PAS domain-containing protein [Geothrix sp. PMB-07]|uniref:PAS domain-containing protein n=1 Tax=Geothrix sp. PMB-07 TaxID=3068640 RepID=UPI0027404905|nr:PAS domain-containing protein [Geothrix sp. PMB-07]WLT30740.1 PAS domain-containing protein [Geothrix sp. PMB-07]